MSISLKRIKSKNKWIPIEMCGMPNFFTILVYGELENSNEFRVHLGYYNDYYKRFVIGENDVKINITHWMFFVGNFGNNLNLITNLGFLRNVYFIVEGWFKTYEEEDSDYYLEKKYSIAFYKGSGEFVDDNDRTFIVESFRIAPNPPKTSRFLILENKKSNKLFYQSAFC